MRYVPLDKEHTLRLSRPWIKKACEYLGNAYRCSRYLEVPHGNVYSWMSTTLIPAKHAVRLDQITPYSVLNFRPDLRMTNKGVKVRKRPIKIKRLE